MVHVMANGVQYELVSGFTTDWSIVNFYKLPEERKFVHGKQTATFATLVIRKESGEVHEAYVSDENRVRINSKKCNNPLYAKITEEVSSFVNFKSNTDITKVKKGDTVVCIDIYSTCEEEHEMLVNSVEYNKEEGIVLFGTDLTHPPEECDEHILRVNASGFLYIK